MKLSKSEIRVIEEFIDILHRLIEDD